jgi:cysteine desulfurase
VGLGEASRVARVEIEEGVAEFVGQLRDRLWERLQQWIPEIQLNGGMDHRLANNLHVSIPGVPAQRLLADTCSEISISRSSACFADEDKPSHVVKAIGVPDELQHTCVRFGLGRTNRSDEIDRAARIVSDAVSQIRSDLRWS